MAIAVLLNGRNDRCGYWLNAVLLAVADIPFIIFVLIPGLTPPWPGLAGPLLWAVAFGLTTIGRLGVAKSRLPLPYMGAPHRRSDNQRSSRPDSRPLCYRPTEFLKDGAGGRNRNGTP